jgi:hypothetical protein
MFFHASRWTTASNCGIIPLQAKEKTVMRKLEIEKLSDSNVSVPHGTVIQSNSSYELCVTAKEFIDSQQESASFALLKSWTQVASCTLLNDPLRRSRRTGILRVGDTGGDMLMVASLSDSVLFSHPVNVVDVSGTGGGVAPTPSGRWTVVDLGVVDAGTLNVSDLEQVKLSASEVAAPLNVIVPSDAFEAYVDITGLAGKFPFNGIVINGGNPFWDHMDSLSLEESRWTLHLVGVAGSVHATLRAGRPVGTERDPDGNLVNSVEVNQ